MAWPVSPNKLYHLSLGEWQAAYGEADLMDILFSDDLNFEGSEMDLISFFSMLEKPQGRFNIVTP